MEYEQKKDEIKKIDPEISCEKCIHDPVCILVRDKNIIKSFEIMSSTISNVCMLEYVNSVNSLDKKALVNFVAICLANYCKLYLEANKEI